MREHNDLTKEISELVETTVAEKIKSAQSLNINFLKREMTKIYLEICYSNIYKKLKIHMIQFQWYVFFYNNFRSKREYFRKLTRDYF